jgi:uncharacterized protein YkwD
VFLDVHVTRRAASVWKAVWAAATVLVLVLALVGTPLGVLAQTTPDPVETPAASAADPRLTELVHRINAVRVANGRLPLADATELDVAAQAHSEDMVANGYLDHTGSDGSEPQERAVRAGYNVPPRSGWIVVEVISAISAEPSGPVNWWFNGDPAVHGKVLLNPRWREIGGGYARGGPYGNYWTVLVGCRPRVVPTVVFDGVAYEHSETCG